MGCPQENNMQEYRKILSVDTGEILERNGRSRVTRFLGPTVASDASPFLLMEVLELKSPDDLGHGFPWRPYEGIECITYFLSADRRRHDAEQGGEPVWICASNGEVREKIPPLSGPVIGTQVWVWVPEGDTQADEISCPGTITLPSVTPSEGVIVNVLAGNYKGTGGALPITWSKVSMFDIYLAPHTEFDYDGFGDDPLIAYVLEGEGYFQKNHEEVFPEGRVIVFEPGQVLSSAATHKGVRFLLLHGSAEGTPVLKKDEIRESEDNWVQIAQAESIRR